MTFAEFEKLPDEVCRRNELRHGKLVSVHPPVNRHVWLQYYIRRLQEACAPEGDIIENRMPFRLMRDHEYWVADIAYMTRATWDRSTRRATSIAPGARGGNTFAIEHSRGDER